jgi:hypothetical protein
MTKIISMKIKDEKMVDCSAHSHPRRINFLLRLMVSDSLRIEPWKTGAVRVSGEL